MNPNQLYPEQQTQQYTKQFNKHNPTQNQAVHVQQQQPTQANERRPWRQG